MSRAKSACNNGASHVNHRQTPHPRLSTPSPCVFLLYSPSNVPRIAASPFIAFLMQLMHYGTPFRVNPTGEILEHIWNSPSFFKLGDVISIHPLYSFYQYLCICCDATTTNLRNNKNETNFLI